MNWEATGAIAEVFGVIAVVISLFYLAQQVRQNTLQLRQDNLRDTIRGALDVNWYYHRDNEAFEVFRKGIDNFDVLPPKEKAHFHSIIVDLTFYYGMLRQMERAGLVDKVALDVNQRYMLAVLVTPGGKQWWELVRQTEPMPRSTIDVLQSLLDSSDLDIKPITELQPWFGDG